MPRRRRWRESGRTHFAFQTLVVQLALLGLERNSRFRTVADGFCTISAIAHCAPAPVLRSAFVHKQPAATAIVGTLPDFSRARACHEAGGRQGDWPQQITWVSRKGRLVPAQLDAMPRQLDTRRRAKKPGVEKSDPSDPRRTVLDAGKEQIVDRLA